MMEETENKQKIAVQSYPFVSFQSMIVDVRFSKIQHYNRTLDDLFPWSLDPR